AAVAAPRADGGAAAVGAARPRPPPRARRPHLRADGDERRPLRAPRRGGVRALRRVRAGRAAARPRGLPRAAGARTARQAGAAVRVAVHGAALGLRALGTRGAE